MVLLTMEEKHYRRQ